MTPHSNQQRLCEHFPIAFVCRHMGDVLSQKTVISGKVEHLKITLKWPKLTYTAVGDRVKKKRGGVARAELAL